MNKNNLIQTLAMVTHPDYTADRMLVAKGAFVNITRGLLELFMLLEFLEAEVREEPENQVIQKISYILGQIMRNDLKFAQAAKVYEQTRKTDEKPRFTMNDAAAEIGRLLDEFMISDEEMQKRCGRFMFCMNKILREKMTFEESQKEWEER